MDAIILAGGAAPPQLAAATNCQDRALIPVGGRPMVLYVVEALQSTTGIDRIAIVASEATRAMLMQAHPTLIFVTAGNRMIDNAVAGMRALDSKAALITTCDVPLVTAATFEEMLAGFHDKQLEAAYAIATRATCEAAFPGGKRTYAKLRGGHVTAGNAVIVSRAVLERLVEVFDTFYRARKNPLAMARLLGMGFLWKTITRQLTVQGAEQKMAELVGCRAGAIDMQDAAIAFDIDKPDHLKVVEKALRERQTAAG